MNPSSAGLTLPGRSRLLSFLRNALREDGAFHDATSRAVIPAALHVRSRIVARAPGVLAGAPVAAWMFEALDPSLRCTIRLREGAAFARGDMLLLVEGRARSIFSAERSALNLLGHLCGVATLTRMFVQRLRGTRAALLDTRKTLPGLRTLEKYAVRAGGGQNHRLDLQTAILIKTNQLNALIARHRRLPDEPAVLRAAIAQAKRQHPRRFVEVEATTIARFEAALSAGPDAILLDNWPLAAIRRAVGTRNRSAHSPRPLLEASGGITLGNIRAIAQTGVERISVGRLTRSAPTVDLALEVL